MFFFEGMDGLNDLAASSGGLLANALSQKHYTVAAELLRNLDKPLDDFFAGACLTHALSCPTPMFQAVLDACAPTEYARSHVPVRSEDGNHNLSLTGTLLTLAAGMNRPKHAALLLQRGYDCNSNSIASANAISDFLPAWFCSRVSNDDFGGLTGSVLQYYRLDKRGRSRLLMSLDCCTPLAAAMVRGSLEVTELLLAQPGILTLESSAVCQAAVLCMNGTPAQRQCVQRVFHLDDAASLLRERPLNPVTFAHFCSLAQLRDWLNSPFSSPESARAILRSWQKKHPRRCLRAPEAKLLLLAKAYPDLCREGWATGLFLQAYLSLSSPRRPYSRLLRCWKQLCGTQRDLSWADAQLAAFEPQALRRTLMLLGEGGTLCANAESLSSDYSIPQITVLMKYVRLRRCCSQGVSAFAQQILCRGGLQTVRRAVQLGILDQESKPDLLALLQARSLNPMYRALVLSLPHPASSALPEVAPLSQSSVPPLQYWTGEGRQHSLDECNAWLAELWTTPLPKDECIHRMRIIHADASFESEAPLFSPFSPPFHYEVDNIQIHNFLAAACCGKNPEMLEAILAEDFSSLHAISPTQFSLSDSFQHILIRGTPLCLAAAAGRKEQVRLLLALGCDPDERDCTSRSYAYLCQQRTIVTPLMAAQRMGQTETVQLLLDAGAQPLPLPEALQREQPWG